MQLFSQASNRLGPDTTEVNDDKSFLIAQTRCIFCVFGARSINTKPSSIHAMEGLSRKRFESSIYYRLLGLPPATECIWLLLLLLRKYRENLERDEEVTMSLTHLDSTLGCFLSSTALDSPARNSALPLRCPRGRPSESGVLSRGWPSPKAGASAMAKERGGRKMLTSQNVRTKRRFYTCLAAPHRCLNRPRL